MKGFVGTIADLMAAGYREFNVEEKLAQDIVLKAIEQSGLKANITVKGGVVMATLANPRMNWLQMSPHEATKRLLTFVREKI